MSHAYPRARPPDASISPAAPTAPSPSRSRIAIAQPSAASARASAFPRLRAAPVTSAPFPRMPKSIYLPLKFGSRLAQKAWLPSEASSLLRVLRNARTSMSIALSIGASSPSSTASMMSLVAIGGRLAIIRASAFASFKVSPSFVSLLARPSARHSGAGTCVPRMRNSSALVRPMRRGIRCEPPKPGVMPRFDSVCPIRADSLTSRKWQAIAISQPPPSAWPLIAAMTGFGNRSIFRITLLPNRMNASTSSPEKAEPRSAPAQKMRSPAPVMMTERTESSFSTELSAALRSRTSSALIALAGGRLSVMTAKLSSRAKSRVSYAMGTDSLEKDGRDRLGRLGQAIGALAEDPRGRQLIHRTEEHLGRDLHRQVAADLSGGGALLEHVVDDAEVGRHLVRRGAPEELLPLTKLDLEHLGELGVLLEHPEVERHDFADFGQRIALGGDLAPDRRDPLRHLLAEEGDEDLVLGLEVEVDRAARDAGLAGDVRDARVVVAVSREDANRGLDDLLRLVGVAHEFLTEPPFILRARRPRINLRVSARASDAAIDLAPAHAPLELDVCRARHSRNRPRGHRFRLGGAAPKRSNAMAAHRPGGHHVREMAVNDLVVGSVAGAAGAAHVGMEDRNHLAQVTHVRRAGAVPGLAALAGAEQSLRISPERARHRRIGAQRQITRQGLDLDLGAEGQRAGSERAVDLRVGVADALERAASHVRLDARLARDDVHRRAAVGQDRVDADGVVVLEGLADRIDPGERDVGRVERVDAHVRRAACVRRAPNEARRLAEAPVVRARHARRAVLGTRRGVDHHRHVDVVQVSQAQQLALAPQELEPPLADFLETPLEVAALLRGDGHQRQAAGQVLEGLHGHQADRRADQPGDLGVVAARVSRARLRVGFGMAGDDERVELAQEREGRPRPLPAGDVGPDAREREPGERSQAELAELRLDERRRPRLLKAELRMAPDRFAHLDDLVGVALDGLVDASLELVASHGIFSLPALSAWR